MWLGQGRAAGMERREQNLETQGKWERKVSLAHFRENGRKEMSKGNRKEGKKPKARPGSPHSLKSEPGKCGGAYKGAMNFFFFSQPSLCGAHLSGGKFEDSEGNAWAWHWGESIQVVLKVKATSHHHL